MASLAACSLHGQANWITVMPIRASETWASISTVASPAKNGGEHAVVRVAGHRRVQLGAPLPHVHNVHLHIDAKKRRRIRQLQEQLHGSVNRSGAVTLPQEEGPSLSSSRKKTSSTAIGACAGCPAAQAEQDDACGWFLCWSGLKGRRSTGLGGLDAWIQIPHRTVVCSADWFVLSSRRSDLGLALFNGEVLAQWRPVSSVSTSTTVLVY
jgi:hypothetical protein